MSKRNEKDCLLDIREAIVRMLGYIDKMTYEKFIKDIKTQDVVVRNLEIAGEVAKNISPTFRTQYPMIPWKKLT